MPNRDSDVTRWWNTLPQAIRSEVFIALGLSRHATSAGRQRDDGQRLDLAAELARHLEADPGEQA